MRKTLSLLVLGLAGVAGASRAGHASAPRSAGTATIASAAIRANAEIPAPAASANPVADPAGFEFFEKRIRPVLVQSCYKCHSERSDKIKGNLVLDSLQGALRGGDTGPAIVPGHPEKSLLVQAIGFKNDDLQMPPKNPLPATAVADLTQWIKMGAPWSGQQAAPAAAAGPTGVLANYDRLRKEHWAWQPLHDPPVPAVKDSNWAKGAIDPFVLAQLEAKGMHPVADADRRTLLRRVTFDLTGLPPSPEAIESFVADRSPNAFEKRVDALLASRAFGERWGRHWLDVARYAESTGSSRNVPYAFAWRYRDYVIDAFNKDKPYDQFIREQIAGDLLPANSDAERNEHLVATGFLALGTKDLNERDRVKYTMDNVDEQIDVTTRSILAMTVSCARCHDHKFDPIPTAEYYSLAGIFKSTEILAGVKGRANGGGMKPQYDAPELLLHLAGETGAAPAPSPTALSTIAPPAIASPSAHPANFGDRRALAALESGMAPARVRDLVAKAMKLREELMALPKDATTVDKRREIRQQLQAIRRQLVGDAPADAPAAPTSAAAGSAIGVQDLAHPGDAAICVHGEPHDLGALEPRGFISVVPVPHVGAINPSQSGRLELADWLTSSENPLTPRVMANRIWEHLMGAGIVRTVDNFGSTGELPANPQLLDHLAVDFMRHGWSVKQLAREIVLSHAYQLGSAADSVDYLADPGDRLAWRMPSRRLDAEEIRDAILSAGGDLDRDHPAGSMAAGLPVAELRSPRFLGQRLTQDGHRSVYLPILRDLVPPVLDLFDFAEPAMVTGARDTTTVATQALFLMNDPFVVEQSEKMAQRLASATGMDDAGRVDLAYEIALGRVASSAEKGRAMRYLSDFGGDFGGDVSYTSKGWIKEARGRAWASFCQALMASAEFRYLN